MNENYFYKQFNWQSYSNCVPRLKSQLFIANNSIKSQKFWNHYSNLGWIEKRPNPFPNQEILNYFIEYKKTGIVAPVVLKEIRSNLIDSKTCNILINTHSNLNVTAGDTVMIINYMNTLMSKKNHVTLLVKVTPNQSFLKNLLYNNYSVVQNDNFISYIDKEYNNFDILFIRNHNILNGLNYKSYLSKSILYGLDVHLNDIIKMQNKFYSIITQSEKLKKKYVENGIKDEKIHVIEPFSIKYDFKLPQRKDDEIRLIYCGTLRDEENILEIIEEFQKIHKERPEVVLKIVYGKIHGNQEFTQKVNHYIKEGVKGITFKHNLSHKDSCYEIATSDIGICWRKNGWGDNGEVSTKVKEYELYGLALLTNNIKINYNGRLLFFKNNIIKILNSFCNNNIIKKQFFDIGYIAETGKPTISGYTIRTECILNELNKNNKVICFVRTKGNDKYRYYEINNCNYIYFNTDKFDESVLDFVKNSSIKIIWSASNYKNGQLSGKIGNYCNIKSIYELRGLWHYTKKYYNIKTKNYNKADFLSYDNNEKNACQNNDIVICENNYIKQYCENTFKIDTTKIGLLENGINSNVTSLNNLYLPLNEKKCTVFGYIGSIVSYEGIENLIKQFLKIDKQKYNCKLLIIGGGKNKDSIQTQETIKQMIQNNEYIRYIGQKSSEECIEIISKYIDVVCLPRVNCEVCNLVTPIKIYEAVDYKKIILCSNVNPLNDIIIHNITGYKFNKENENELYDMLLYILNNKPLTTEVRERLYNNLKDNTWEKNIRKVLEFIK